MATPTRPSDSRRRLSPSAPLLAALGALITVASATTSTTAQTVDVWFQGVDLTNAQLAPGLDGELFVSVPSHDAVFRVSATGTAEVVIDAGGDGQGNALVSPGDVVADGSGGVFVAAQQGLVFHRSPAGTVTKVLDGDDPGPGLEFTFITALELDPTTGDLLVGTGWTTTTGGLLLRLPTGGPVEVLFASTSSSAYVYDVAVYTTRISWPAGTVVARAWTSTLGGHQLIHVPPAGPTNVAFGSGGNIAQELVVTEGDLYLSTTAVLPSTGQASHWGTHRHTGNGFLTKISNYGGQVALGPGGDLYLVTFGPQGALGLGQLVAPHWDPLLAVDGSQPVDGLPWLGAADTSDVASDGERLVYVAQSHAVFRYDAFGWNDLGGGVAGQAGVPDLHVSGPLTAGSPLVRHLVGAPPNSLLLAALSLDAVPVPALGGTLFANPIHFQWFFVSDATGSSSLTVEWPPGMPSGTALTLQFLVQDATIPGGIGLSNAARRVTP